MEEKNTIKIRFSTVILTIIILILIVIIGFLVIERKQNAEIWTTNENSNIVNEEEIEKTGNNTIETKEIQPQNAKYEEKLNHFNPDNGKIIQKQASYTLENNSIDKNISVNVNSNKEVELLVSSSEETSYLLEGMKRKANYPEIIKGFTSTVDEVKLGMLGQEIHEGIILFLMEDGTVQYLGLMDALKTNDLTTRGRLGDLENIVRIESARVSYEEGGTMTMIAIDNKGAFYDIGKIVEDLKIDLEKVK